MVIMWGKGYTHILLVGLQIGETTLETGIEPPFDPVIPLLGLFPKDLKSAYYSDTAQFTIAKLWN